MGDRADRELARRIDQRDARPARRRSDRCRDRRRVAAEGEPLADRRAAAAPWRRSTRCSPTRRYRGSARASCAASSPTPRSCPPARPPRRCGVVASEARRGRAALGTSLAARIYGATIIREGVEDRDDNQTRFVWLARAGADRRASRRSAAPLRSAGAASGRPRSSSGARARTVRGGSCAAWTSSRAGRST